MADQATHFPARLCNDRYVGVTVNRYCLLDELETAFQIVRHWSMESFDANRSYVGPMEPPQ